ncbi:hypothetical protein K439DRAFT_1420600 [Ramaria rubella]|nr:hypothetical protein K439DRAFT_1420600 [Ramaria rubella]
MTFLQNVKNLRCIIFIPCLYPLTCYCLAQRHNVELARLAPPSSAASLTTFRIEQEKCWVLNSHPSKNFGPPISLFHPVFDLFQANMTKEDPISLETYTYVKSLFQASAEIYSEEKYRTAEIHKHFQNLVYGAIAPIIADKVVNDGVIIEVYQVAHAYLGILEVKNEIGTAVMYLSEDDLRSKCYCPTIILTIAGPWLCVLGAVYLEQAIIQPLTDYLWLGGDAFSDSRIISMGRMFNALKSAFFTLRQYYSPAAINAHDQPDGFPFVRSYETEKFSYLEKLAEEYPTKLVFKAKHQSSGELLVVKFTSTYNAVAHRLLAEKRLALTLYYAGSEHPAAPKYGGRYMIIIEFVEELPPSDILSPDQASQIKEAIELLHSYKWVFGDLRLPNVLITGKGAMLVDFDWCSRADEGLYPMSLNQEGIDWAEGVVPSGVMKEKHDLDMLEKLCHRG